MRGPLIVGVVLASSACRPFRQEPSALEVDLPAEWTAPEEPSAAPYVGGTWWEDFEDQDLDRLVDEALQNNQDLRAAAARVRAAVARADIAGAPRLPWVDVSGTSQRQKQVFVGLPVPGGTDPLESTSTRHDLGASVSWELDLWGRLAAIHEASFSEALATAAEREAVRLSLTGQVAAAWFGLKEARLQVELSRRTVAAFEDTTRIVRSRYENGLAPVLDLRLAESDEASARAQLEGRVRQEIRSARLLELLVGRYPSAAVEAVPDLPAPPPAVPVGVPAQTLERRPDLVAARLRLRRADVGLEAARASLLPRISLTASGGLTSDDLNDIVRGDFGVWSLIGNLTQPVFEGGRLRAGVDLARAEVREAAEIYARVALDACFEVEESLTAERILAESQRHLELASRSARSAAELAEDRYASGLVDLLTVLDAQRRALVAEAAWLAVRRDRLTARIDLHLALGGGFSVESLRLEDAPPTQP